MHNEIPLKKLMKELQRHGVLSTEEALKDLQKLVKTDVNEFVQAFFRDFIRKDFKSHNRFEKLKLTKVQKRKLKGCPLMRYEYRNSSNLRCIFILYNDDNNNVPIILCAFNEDGKKKIGKTSYAQNINRAIDIFENLGR